MKKALIIVDAQNDFASPKGTLYVKDGEKTIPFINSLIQSEGYNLIIATQDWHPKNHVSFALNHKDAKIFDVIDAKYGKQVLWPVHCVQDCEGAQLHPLLLQSKINYIIRKGINAEVDSYSVVYDNGHQNYTFLPELLNLMDIVDVVGLATDYCVKFSVLDLKKSLAAAKVRVLLKGCAGVAADTSEAAVKEMRDCGAEVII
ncbi:MAG: bifunctional nicotinamidase/pyrazinamidase [Endomicrobium sp.]|jgi:nicotinamidase/pyrazinamidase|nr:bifunctional nicotinamidase/pyrazinamidase [Endomicrobium sp.]